MKDLDVRRLCTVCREACVRASRWFGRLSCSSRCLCKRCSVEVFQSCDRLRIRVERRR